MFDTNFIRNTMRRYIDQKIDKFIIYPFGVNGVNIKNILNEYFGLQPVCIVDNVYSRYNKTLIDSDRLRNLYQKDMYIILTIEDESSNRNIYKELSEFVPSEHIINLYTINLLEMNKKTQGETKIEIKEHSGKGFRVCDFLPVSLMLGNNDIQVQKKIKVRITYHNFNLWNAMSTMCQAFKIDPLFDVLLIVGGKRIEESIKRIHKYGYRFVRCDEYQMAYDRPDIVILTFFGENALTEMNWSKEYRKLTCYLAPVLRRYPLESLESFYKYFRDINDRYEPDYFLFDSLLYGDLKTVDFLQKKIVEMGNPKFDGIYYAMQKKKYPKQWEKLERKRTVLYANAHGMDKKKVIDNLTFDLYAKMIFRYAYENPEMGLIFRPNPRFTEEMFEAGFWSKSDLQLLKDYCANSPNVIYDDTENYESALSIADGILIDAIAGLVCSTLPLGKPVCAAYRSKEDVRHYPDLLKALYSAYEPKDIIQFFEMVRKEQDPMKELREEARKKYVKSFDGNNGLKIKEFIKEKYYEKIVLPTT